MFEAMAQRFDADAVIEDAGHQQHLQRQARLPQKNGLTGRGRLAGQTDQQIVTGAIQVKALPVILMDRTKNFTETTPLIYRLSAAGRHQEEGRGVKRIGDLRCSGTTHQQAGGREIANPRSAAHQAHIQNVVAALKDKPK
jgi:hypothetical protein